MTATMKHHKRSDERPSLRNRYSESVRPSWRLVARRDAHIAAIGPTIIVGGTRRVSWRSSRVFSSTSSRAPPARGNTEGVVFPGNRLQPANSKRRPVGTVVVVRLYRVQPLHARRGRRHDRGG